MSKNVSFETVKKSQSGKKVKLTVVFVAVILLLVFVSGYAVLRKNDFDIKSALGGDVESTQLSTASPRDEASEGEKHFLFWCKDSQTDALKFLWVVKIKMPKGEYTIYSPSIDDSVEYKGRNCTLSEVFSLDDAAGLVSALNSVCNTEIDSYIGSDTENFKQMMNYLGSVTVDLPQPVEYRGEFNLILMQGENVLKGDTLYKYLVYTNYMQGNSSEMRCNALGGILDNVIEPDNVDRLDTIFSKIANLLITDITIVDFSASRDFIGDLFNTGVKSIVTAQKPTQVK